MTIVGFLFTKIQAEKKQGAKGKINISNNVTIKDVKEADTAFTSESQKGISFQFQFTSKYDQGVGEILLEGNVLYMGKKEEVKKIISAWKKEKKIEKDIMKDILNTLLTKCNIEALIISREIGLPPPIPLPKVEQK